MTLKSENDSWGDEKQLNENEVLWAGTWKPEWTQKSIQEGLRIYFKGIPLKEFLGSKKDVNLGDKFLSLMTIALDIANQISCSFLFSLRGK